jgi:uncharacterized protein (TIGR03067 family)
MRYPLPSGRALALVLLALAARPSRGQDSPPPSSAEVPPALAAHQGRWQGVSTTREGRAADPAIARSIVRTVTGDRVVWSRDGKTFAATRLRADPNAKPMATLDVIPEGGPHRGEPVLGIYRLETSVQGRVRLTICMADPGQPRPTTFDSPAGSGRTLMEFDRQADPPANDPGRK